MLAAAIAIFFLAVQAFGQTSPERFWLAGRYDGNRVIVYFDAVKFNRTVPRDIQKITSPVAGGFFAPLELPPGYIARFQKKPGAEHFAVGDQYDLLTGDGAVIVITLSTLVGTEGDEEVGNDSYIGALATVAERDVLFLDKDYFVVRRHRPASGRPAIPAKPSDWAHILDDPPRFSLQSRIVGLLTQKMKEVVSPEEWEHLRNVSPRFSVQSFYLANGGLRYYARLDWSPHAIGNDETNDILGAWLTATPALRILAVETRQDPYVNAALPRLDRVIDLDEGRTGMIVTLFGEDSGALRLVEYRDGASLQQMPHLHEISAGE